MSSERGKALTRREFDAVIRRAAELASSDSDGTEGDLSEAELYRIAREVGLSERHVRTALSEVRTGLEGGGLLDRVFGPASVRAARVVPGTPESLATKLDDFFVRTQLLQNVRKGRNVLQYRPSLDWASQLARAASLTSRKYFVASAKSVEVHLDEVDEGATMVELVVDPGTRGDSVAGAAIGGGTVGTGLGIAVAASLVAVAPLGVATGAGVVVGGGLLAAIGVAVGGSHKKKVLQVQSEVEGILDLLERGESLEPPPASWRRWVKRQFHGVARELRTLEKELGEKQDPGDGADGY